MPWDVDGIAGEDDFGELLYNAPSETLIATFERTSSAVEVDADVRVMRIDAKGTRRQASPVHSVGSVYARRRGETSYRKVFGPDDFTSARDVVTAEATPVAYFLVWAHRRNHPSGADWKALARVDLRSFEVAFVVQELDGEWSGAWLATLLDASADGRTLTCIVGRSRLRESGNGSSAGATVDYSLCRLDVEAKTIEALSPLRNTFF